MKVAIKISKIFFIFALTLAFGSQVFAQNQSIIPQAGNSNVSYGNKSFNIKGVGTALAGCLGIGDKISGSQLGSIFGSVGKSAVKVDDSSANKKESCGDSLAYAASRLVIQNMSKSTINWATSGNNGSPFYPTNYESLYKNIRATEMKTFITELQATDTSNPYNLAFAKSLASKARSEAQTFAEKYKYTGPDAKFFGDFKKGGWEAWYKYTLVPQNNTLGYSRIASEQINKLQETATNTIKEELQNNAGFLSQKVCDDKGFVPWSSDTEMAKVLAEVKKNVPSAVARAKQAVCKNYKVATPGSIISKQLQDVLGSPLRQAEQVDEINEALGSVFDGIVAKLITNGLKSLSSTDFRNSVNFSFNATNAPTANESYDTSTGGSFWDSYNTNFDLHRDLPGIIKTQKAYIAQLEKNNQIISKVLDSIDKMDYALPGPRVGWAEGMEQKAYEAAKQATLEFKEGAWDDLASLQKFSLQREMLAFIEDFFVRAITLFLGFYQNAVDSKFNPATNANMPKNSAKMIALITTRQSYEEAYAQNDIEIQNTNDVILQLTDINNQVIALYKRACERFLKETGAMGTCS
ncbi:hypothetical protein A3J61_01355 [Candidatus Nomurabacteria bacterium RIFCSPHIGHO2_02_FULL_38_15]|uniref:Uncharacterized protein n=1 Tax=Candidatus Nomurabacteria bacterium RIFCSPHIGHO2_02_FULL_38_15 TaxID=1801752 RepID=A0A1F6VSW9_9BACT|nr:MAG: hypothetical protein A3J61_01355 [Candidatus Nomurabacteria bacterium RIFCSPHIGHO2_02_FULL_38_15]